MIARLSMFRYDRLGHYADDDSLSEYGTLGKPGMPWASAVREFQAQLQSAGARQSFDRTNAFGYSFLFPDDITNGISV